jgi:hypothetical protein
MHDKTIKRCKHTGCNCVAPQDSPYCSPHCETVESSAELACDCGHGQCAGKIN